MRAAWRPFVPSTGSVLRGAFEVRDAHGRVKRLQEVTLPLPSPLLRWYARGAPDRNHVLELADGARLTLWAPLELIELQVGYRWHGFTGKRMPEWDERDVVFAERDGDPLALRLDEPDGPVRFARRGEGRYAF